MSKLRELIIKISANSSSFQSEIAKASRTGSEYNRLMERGVRRSAAATRDAQRALHDLNGQLVSATQAAKGLTGAFAGIFATSKLVETADKWTNLNSRLKLATQSSLDLAESQSMLMAMSQKTGTSFEANATVFARAATPMRALSYATKDIVDMTEALSAGLRVSGASASEASSVLIQFSQAMSSGVLRGEEFNAMAENGGRILQALADGLGVSRTKMKAMADGGLLTMDKVIPALLSQLGKLRTESESMGATVEKSMTRVQNSFMQWVGGANESTGTTKALAGAMDGLANNLNEVAAAGLAAVGLFGAKAIGNRTSAITSSTSALIQNTRAEINNADQAYRNAQVQVANARATELQAQRNVLAARSRLLQTTNAQQFAAAQLRLNRAIEAEAKAHTVVTQSIAARTAAQSRLNAVTSIGSRMGGALLGAVGGIPGALIMAAGAAYLLYQNQKQAKEEAREHAKEAGNIKKELSNMSASQLGDTKGKLQADLDVAKADMEEYGKQVKRNQYSVEEFARRQAKGMDVGDSLKKYSIALSENSAKYEEARQRVEELRSVLSNLYDKQAENAEKERRIVAAISEARRTGNVTIALQNQKLEYTVEMMERLKQAAIDVSGLHIQVPEVKFEPSEKIVGIMKDQAKDIDLAARSGLDRVRKEAEYKAIEAGLNPGDPRQVEYINKIIDGEVRLYNIKEKSRQQEEAARKAKNDAEQAAREAAKTAQDYAKKVSDLNNQLATEAVRYKEGDAAAEAFALSQQRSSRFTHEQNSSLIKLNQQLAATKQRYQDLNEAIAADPFRAAAKSTQEAYDQLNRQKANGDIASTSEYNYRKDAIFSNSVRDKAEASQAYAVSAQADLRGDVDPQQDLENQLAKKQALYETYAAEAVISEERKNALILAAERDTHEKRIEAAKQTYASQGHMQKMAIDLFSTTQQRMGNMLTGMLTGTQTLKEGMTSLFSSLAQSVIQNLIEMAMQAIITNTILKSIMGVAGGFAGGAGGAMASTGGSMSSIGSGTTVTPDVWQSPIMNAKGGVYQSSNLSQYSGQVVSSPTLFAFAKGAGLMGEAGPEAIMPLARTSDGNLGVRLIGGNSSNTGAAPQVSITIHNEQNTQTTSPGWEQFGSEIGRFVEQRYRDLIGRDLGQGGVLNRAIRGGR